MNSRLILIRHGITEGNKKQWFYGGVDIPLIDEGIAALQQQVKDGIYPELPPDAQFFTSALQRTKQTLRIIYGKSNAKALPLLNEMHFGAFECVKYNDMKDDPIFQEWIMDEEGDIAPPGGESRNEFQSRIRKGIDEVIGYHQLKEWSHRHGGEDATTVVVCHGGVISAAMMYMFPDPSKNMWDWSPDPGMGYIVNFSGKMDGKPLGYQSIGREAMGYEALMESFQEE